MNALSLTDAADERAPSWESADGPGRRLRDARQARGLELARVADQLHLKPTLIAALEQDDYQALPGSVFVVGYLRNYARLLGLDPEPLLAAYRRSQPQAEPAPPKPVTAGGPRAGGGHLGARLFSLAVILALLGLSYAWWQDYRPAVYPEGTRLESASGDLELGAAAPANAPLASLAAPAEPVGASYEPPSETAPEPSPPTRALVADEVAQPEGSAPPAPPSSPTALTTAEPPPAIAPAMPAAAVVAEPLSEPAAEAPAAPSEGVVMEFSGPCWVDIRDSERRFKLFGEMKDGDRHVLAGTPPYSVIIGNAAAVRITVDGKPFELEGIARGNVARFTLDPARLP